MRTVNAYLFGVILISFSAVVGASCGKGGSDTTLVGNWSRSSDFDGNARSEAVLFTIGNQTYLATGTTDRDKFQDLWQYDVDRQYWAQLADFPGVGRASAVAFAIGNFGYVCSGVDANANYLNDNWQYDVAGNKWNAKSSFPTQMTARYDASAFAIGNFGYVTCGYNNNYLKDMWQYNPANDTWTQKASIGGSKRSAATTFVINNLGYIVSGNNNGSALNDLWSYDPTADKWTEKNKITNVSTDAFDDQYTTIIRYNAVAFIMNNLVYLATGVNGAPQTDTWEYNPTTDLWTKKTAWEGTPRQGAVAFTLKGRGFVLTGSNGSLYFDNMYEWHPNDPVNVNDN